MTRSISSWLNPFSGSRRVDVIGSPGSTLITRNVNTYVSSTTITAWPVRRATKDADRALIGQSSHAAV